MSEFRRKKVVVLGGGNGSATTLRALKRHTDLFEIYGVITMSDSGGSSGRLRAEFNTLPAGDILRAILASSKYAYNEVLKPLFYKKRFVGAGKLADHNLGNLFLVLASEYNGGDFMSAVRALHQAVEAQAVVYPVTLERTDLVAELENGVIVRGEAVIDRPTYDRSLKIKRVWLEPAGQGYSDAMRAIEQADYIILGPGSLYCSIVAALLPAGIQEAIGRSRAKLIHIVGNKYELDGETGPTELCTFLWTLEEYLPRKIDTVIFNTVQLNKEQQAYYDEKGWALLRYNPEQVKKSDVIGQPFERPTGGLSADRLGMILRKELSGVKH